MASPKYLDSYDDVPVQIPDDFGQQEKEDAVELAESLIEVELEDGGALSAVTSVHKAAIKQRATCELVKGASHPDDATIGDIQDDGTSKSDYAQDAFCRHYHELVDKISAFMDDDGGNTPFVYNTSKSQDMLDWERFDESIDVAPYEDSTQRNSW